MPYSEKCPNIWVFQHVVGILLPLLEHLLPPTIPTYTRIIECANGGSQWKKDDVSP